MEKDPTTGAEFDRRARVLSVHGVYHPTRPLWVSGRLAGKSVDETMVGVDASYRAYLAGGRVIYDINDRWDLGFAGHVLYSPKGASKQYAAGLETGYLVMQDLWLSAGYNWTGFEDRDLSGADCTAEGWFMRIRWKFDEDLIEREPQR